MSEIATTSRSHEPVSAVRLLHSGMTVSRYYRMHFMGALFPLTAGLMLYGWRAGLTLVLVIGSAAFFLAIWRHIGSRGRQLHISHGLWHAMLLGLMLPPHLATGTPDQPGGQPVWPIAVAAGGVLAIFQWLLGGLGGGRVHPVLVTFLLLIVLFQEQMTPHWVLQRDSLLAGDVLKGPQPGTVDASPESWVRRARVNGQDSFWGEPAARKLIYYTTGTMKPDRGQLPLHELLRDRMPPLEDLIVAGQPAPIGMGSAIAVIIGGLFLLYRGLIDFRIPLLAPVMAFAVLLVLPVPTVITGHGPHFRWLAMREADVRWETAVTFVNYEMMASPILFVAFFLATAPALRPLGRRARALYAIVLGLLCGVAQLYASVSFGPYLALLVVSLLSSRFDRWFSPRPLV